MDGQYQPAGEPTPLENVNYMVIHGSHDGDVSSFNGLRAVSAHQVHRRQAVVQSRRGTSIARTTASGTRVWGNKDNGPRSGRFLDLRGLIPPEEQRQFSKVTIGAFLEATLQGKKEYLPMFRDHRVAGAWLPKTMYITRFQESGFKSLATFDEDVDVTTGSVPGVTIGARQPRDVEGERAQPSQRQRRSAQHQRRDARLEQPHSRRRHDEARQAGVVHDHAQRLAAHGAATSGASRRSICRSRRPTPSPARAHRRATRRRKPTAPRRTRRSRRAKKPDAKAGEGHDARSISASSWSTRRVTRRDCRSRASASRAGRSRFTSFDARDEEKQRFPTQFELVLQTYVMPLADFVQAAPAVRPDTSSIRPLRI